MEQPLDLQVKSLYALCDLWRVVKADAAARAEVEAELSRRIADNTKYSLDDLFDLCFLQRKSLLVDFIPTTHGYRAYGRSIRMNLILEPEEYRELLENSRLGILQPRFGVVKASILAGSRLPADVIHLAAVTGFEIRDVLHVRAIERGKGSLRAYRDIEERDEVR